MGRGPYKRRKSYRVRAGGARTRQAVQRVYRMQARSRARPFARGYDRTGGYYGRNPGEMKFHDIDVDDAVVAAGGVIQNTGSINLIPQGVTEKQRVGRKCVIKSIGWRFECSLPEQDAQGTPENNDVLRVIMYQDKQCNGATAAVTDILESADYQSFNNLANSSRFRTLMDRTYALNWEGGMASDGAGLVSQARTTIADTFFKRCNIPLEFDSTTGALTEIRSNNIGVLLVSSQGSSQFLSKIRLRFSDGS